MDDPFDELLGLEEQYYKEGYALGAADGAQAGRIEGRTFGLEKGFEKYVALGMLAGQCAVWQTRISSEIDSDRLPALAAGRRAAKHIETLSALVDAETLSHENTEEAVAEFDERLKAASGKAKVISNIVGESTSSQDSTTKPPANKDQSNIEDFLASKAIL